ncbi:MAG: CDP-alcohol phosphatidyltransferase family protein [Desulfobulbaceae bacterium]|uniref:CDP-alcohol phosphatidyltransferase family protein n=1 Tax=Candidatus Desulfobia pelagia TaxID=2841692 RepID=A0A8J6TGD2_9BACT|nr:CDP-alcohol phosphatidyltransferase family protein [Candidatus Desulfobia pelagia]
MPKKFFHRFIQWIGYSLGITPNQITWGRLIIFIPGWLTWIYKNELAQWTAMPWQLFGTAAMVVVTIVIIFDIVDGALARETGQVSAHGKILDPLVDKFITYSTLILFWSAINKIGLLVLFALDITSTFLRGVQVAGANQFGKKKALSQNISKFFFATAVLIATPWLNTVGNGLIWLAVILATISVGIRIFPPKVKNSISVILPQILTLSNLAAGIGTIWCALNNMIGIGVLLNFTAMAFDLTDGAVARKLGVTSTFGKYFDTAADLISFGAGPAFLVVAVNDFSPMSMGLGALYFIATCIRLYDYGRSKDITPVGFFRGFPSPAAAWLVASSVVLGQAVICLTVLVIAAALMCLFKIHWIHFNRALPNMTVFEITAALVLGGGLAYAFTPLGAAAGPIVVYLFSPAWRQPETKS